MHAVCIDNVPKQCAELLYTCNLYTGENEVGPDSRHVPYFIINVDFREKSVHWSQTLK